jgi:hypothetical protein
MKINYTSEDIKKSVLTSLTDSKKLFMLRMGDGEMILANNVKDKITGFTIKQIGRELTVDELKLTQHNMVKAVKNSTILGLPMPHHIRSNSLWESLFEYYENIKNSNESMWDKKYCSINSHFDLLNSGVLFEVFSKINKIVVVSSRNISKQLQIRFPNIKSVEYYSLPAEQNYEVIKNIDVNIFDRIDEISKSLSSKKRGGELLIFGAGPFGKILGSVFSENGGVSLDLGSVFDLFVGKVTRGKGKGANIKIKPSL